MNNADTPGNGLVLQIGIPGFSYQDLYDPLRLRDLTNLFHDSIRSTDPDLWTRFDHYRTTLGNDMKPEEISEVIVDTAPLVPMSDAAPIVKMADQVLLALSGITPPYFAANTAVTTPSELMAVQGFDREAYTALAPYVAALPRGTEVNVNTASNVVLASLSDDISLSLADSLIEVLNTRSRPNVSKYDSSCMR